MCWCSCFGQEIKNTSKATLYISCIPSVIGSILLGPSSASSRDRSSANLNMSNWIKSERDASSLQARITATQHWNSSREDDALASIWVQHAAMGGWDEHGSWALGWLSAASLPSSCVPLGCLSGAGWPLSPAVTPGTVGPAVPSPCWVLQMGSEHCRCDTRPRKNVFQQHFYCLVSGEAQHFVGFPVENSISLQRAFKPK